MKLIVLGTGPFAVPMFQSLVKSAHEVMAVVTKSAGTSGRRKDSANPVRDAAVAAGIPVHEPDDINAPLSIEWLRHQSADALVVCDYGRILSRDCLAAARLGGINLHGSLLPRYRGAAPIQWAIYRGETETGVTVIHLTPALDAGPMLVQIAAPIQDDDTAATLEPRLAALGGPAVLDALCQLDDWDGQKPLGIPQDSRLANKAPRLQKQQGKIDWTRSADELRNQIRAFVPWPGSFTSITRERGEPLRVIIHQASVVAIPAAHAPGTVVDALSGRLVVACGDQGLSIERIQPSGKRVMAADEFLRGYPLAIGTQLSSPMRLGGKW